MSDQATSPTDQWHKTACILCSANCGVEVRLDDREITRVRGNKSHVGSKGYTCEKALRINHYQNARGRLTSPLRREPDGSYTELDWDTAIERDRDRLPRRHRPPRRRQDLLLRRRRSGKPPGRRVRRRDPTGAGRHTAIERSRAGEDGGGLGRRSDVRHAHARALRRHRGRDLPRQESVALARLRRGPAGAEGDRGRRRHAR